MSTIERITPFIPVAISKLLIACTSKEVGGRPSLECIHIEYDEETKISTFISSDNFIMCIVTSSEYGDFTGNYLPGKSDKGFWNLEKTDVQFSNWSRIVPPQDKQKHIGTLRTEGTRRNSVMLRTCEPMNIDLSFLMLLRGFNWEITQEADNEFRPYVCSCIEGKYALKVLIMPCTKL